MYGKQTTEGKFGVRGRLGLSIRWHSSSTEHVLHSMLMQDEPACVGSHRFSDNACKHPLPLQLQPLVD
jgi:hypothetical protein